MVWSLSYGPSHERVFAVVPSVLFLLVGRKPWLVALSKMST